MLTYSVNIEHMKNANVDAICMYTESYLTGVTGMKPKGCLILSINDVTKNMVEGWSIETGICFSPELTCLKVLEYKGALKCAHISKKNALHSVEKSMKYEKKCLGLGPIFSD